MARRFSLLDAGQLSIADVFATQSASTQRAIRKETDVVVGWGTCLGKLFFEETVSEREVILDRSREGDSKSLACFAELADAECSLIA